MDTSKFAYVTYIASSPDTVWRALIDPSTTAKYWQHENISEWRPGARWVHRSTDKDGTVHLVGKVLEFAPPRRLALSWAEPDDEANEQKHSRVTCEIEPYHDVVRLTVTHDRLERGSEMESDIQDGWPMVLSSLKSLLESGKALPKLW